MQNPDSTIADGHGSKSKSEVDPDSNSTPKVDFKKIILRARYSHSSRGSYEGFPPFPCKQTDSETERHREWKIGPEISPFNSRFFFVLSLVVFFFFFF